MSIRRDERGGIVLDGICPVEDAELLLQMLQQSPVSAIDWRGCAGLHTAVVQIILAAKVTPIGPCGDAWVQQWVSLSGS